MCLCKENTTPSSSVAARGLGQDLPKRWLLSHLFRAEGSCPRGGRGGAGGQAQAITRPPVTEGLHSDFASLSRRRF